MLPRLRLPPFRLRGVEYVLVVLGLAALVFSAIRDRLHAPLTEDEHEYLYAAANLARSGTLAFTPPGATAPLPNAYREPGYPLLIAAAWRVANLEAPASAAEVEQFFSRPPLWRSIRALHLGLLALAAAASGWAARRLGGARAGAAAFLFVAASPALQERGAIIMTELLAAAWMSLLAAAMLAAAQRRVAGARAVMAILALLPLFRAEALLLLPLSGLAVSWQLENGARRRRWRAAIAALALTALPSVFWMARNQLQLGKFLIADRSGLAFAVRARLDGEVARVGVLPALLAWTPLDGAQAKARELAPSSTLVDYRWTGPGNFFTRTIRDWNLERRAPGADPLEVDRRYRAGAWRTFAAHPVAHLLAAVAVGWRGWFAERSPGWLSPFDLTFACGVLHLVAFVLVFAVAVFRRDRVRCAYLLPFAVIFSFHALGTEFLPRYAAPLLPCAWVAVALLLFGSEHVQPVQPEIRQESP